MNKFRVCATVSAAVLAAAGVGIASIHSVSGAASLPSRTLADSEVLALLLRSGIDAEPLAAVGLLPSDASTVVLQFATFVNRSPDLVTELREGILNARAARTASVRAARDQQAGLAATAGVATTAAADPAAAFQSSLDEAFAFATSNLTAAQRSNLLALKQRAAWEIPVHVKLAERSEAEWVALRDAYAARAVAQSRGEPPSPEAVRLIERAEADPAARNAKANVQANAAAIDDILRTFAR